MVSRNGVENQTLNHKNWTEKIVKIKKNGKILKEDEGKAQEEIE